jgi:glutathione S-transferase
MEPAFIMRRMEIGHRQGAMGWAAADEVEAVLDRHLSENRYVLGDAFSVADIMVGGGIHYLMMFKVMNETPVFKEYTARITARPAFQRMLQKDAAAK